MTRMIGKHDVVLKTMITESTSNDLHALATLHRTTVANMTRDIIEKHLYGRIGLISMDEDRTELKAKRSTGTGTAQ